MADEVYRAACGTRAPGQASRRRRSCAWPRTRMPWWSIQSFSQGLLHDRLAVGWLVARRDLAGRAAQFERVSSSATPRVHTRRQPETALAEGEEELARDAGAPCAPTATSAGRRSPECPASPSQPDGAFYLFPKIEGVEDSFEFCRRLLIETKVGLAPGSLRGGRRRLGAPLATPPIGQSLETAMDRLSHVLTPHTFHLTRVRLSEAAHATTRHETRETSAGGIAGREQRSVGRNPPGPLG